MNQIEQTITTLEIAEMMGMRHDRVLRKLEGQDVRGKHTEGIIEILTHHNLGASDYFIPSTYKDESGKENKCYKVTKLGCDFLANKRFAALTKMIAPSVRNRRNAKNIANWHRFTK